LIPGVRLPTIESTPNVNGPKRRKIERPTMRMPRLSLAIALLMAFATSVGAQSLADVAKREEIRRKQVKKPSRVITNKDLKAPDHPPPPPPPAAEAQPPATGPVAAPGDEAPASDEEKLAKDEQAWRQRMTDARQALDRSQMYLDALQSKINALWADFTARDDPAQRAQLETERKRALAEFERVKIEIEANKKALADLEEEARKTGVPPGWLR
jgi:DNA repair exonuclease SbcCD ATPase subunit